MSRGYRFRYVLDNGNTTWADDRPMDGRPYTVEIYDMKAYEEAVKTGEFYGGVGHVLVDQRVSVG